MDSNAQSTTTRLQPIIDPNAAGIDVGATAMYVAVPAGRDRQPVRRFGTFTADLIALAGWLQACGIRTVAMESTGVYWVPLFQVLEERGFEVLLVNARHVNNVPGRKSDVSDCQWLQYLHSVGLLRGSFHPPQAVRAIRTLFRHRDNLVKMAASHVQHMQKALVQMNMQLHHVLSDLTGKTGLAIVDAILAGERDPGVLAGLCDPRIKASKDTVIKSLQGDWRPEHLFTLHQSVDAYRYYHRLMVECDAEMEEQLKELDTGEEVTACSELPTHASRKKAPRRNEIRFVSLDLAAELHRLFGVDLTRIPGLQSSTVYLLFTELGTDLSRFPTAGHFASWLGLCPDNRKSGEKVLGAGTRHVQSRAAGALRMAALSLHRSQSYLGDYYRRMRTRLGTPKAITAAAHKLARIIYTLVTTGQGYDDSVFVRNEARYQHRKERRLKSQAAALGYVLVPKQPVHQLPSATPVS